MPTPILYTIPNFITAGSGRAMLNIIERLDRTKFSPAVCVSKKGGKLDQAVMDLGIPFIEADLTVEPRPYASLLLRAWNAARIFRPYRFALWHSFHYSDDYTEAIIARFAGAHAWIYSKKNMGWGSRAWKLRSLFATQIISLNTNMADDFFSSPFLRNKQSFIPRGVDVEKFFPNVQPQLNLRNQLGLSAETPVVAVVAHLVPVKGHPTLFQALTQIPNAHLWLAGKPLDREYVAALSAQLESLGLTNRVHFLGGIENIPALLAEADIAALPTWARWRMEGCPVALLEAMSCGKACIASDIPGARDLIVHEESGLLFPPEDSQALASAINRLIQDPVLRAQFGASARRRVEERFAIEHEAARHEALYRKILKI